VKRARRRPPLSASYPAPTRGWIANRNLAEPEKNGARILDNLFPETETVRLFGGKQKYATIGSGDEATSLFSYKSGNNNKLFAANENNIYDITSISDASSSPSAAVGSLTSGDWISAQIQTPGGTFLRLVNGADTSRIFDGTSFSTGTIYDSTDGGMSDITPTFGYAFVYKKRLFFLQNNLTAYYMESVETISGSAVKLPLNNVFKRGGSLLFGGTWSQDTGDGLNVYCVFFTTEGEAAVFSGEDPSDANNWRHVSTYRIGKPRGKRAWFNAGGDIAVATDIGLVALSQARETAVEVLGARAASWPIDTVWGDRVKNRSFNNWNVEIWPERRMVLVGLPGNADYQPECLVANSTTGAWCRRTNWNARCFEVFNGRCFAGASDGKIFELEVTGADDGTPYTGTCLLHADDLRDPVSNKIARLMRPIIRAREEPNPAVFVNAGFDDTLPAAPDAPVVSSENTWDDPDTKWDEAVWSLDDQSRSRYEKWYSVSADGDQLAPGIRITSGNTVAPLTDIARFDLIYEKTGPVV
jgi:hypothetical protein